MARIQPQGQKTTKADDVAVAEPEESPFRHYVPGEKPRTDQAYFELLLLKVFRAEGETPNFEDTWPRAVQALAGMNLLRLSTYTAAEVREAIGTVGGEFNARMGVRAASIVAWAESFWRIRQIYGAFRQYVRSFDADGFDALMEDLKVRLAGLTPEFLTGYLRDAGEKGPAPERQIPLRPPQRQPESRLPDQQRRPSEQQQQGTPQEGGRGDRRQRHRGRGGPRPPQQQTTQPQRPPKTQTPVTPKPLEGTAPDAKTSKDGQPAQRRRGRRRFFRRREKGADKSGGQSSATTGT